MMKRIYLTLFFLGFFAGGLLISEKGHAQAAKSVFAELAGPGVASVNFDMRFSDSDEGIGGRIGIGGFSIDDNGALFIPAAVNYLMGKDGRNYLELGAGATFTSINADDELDNSDPFTGTFGHLHFGYRLQPADEGFTFRAGITPIFGKGYFIPYYASLSFGYRF